MAGYSTEPPNGASSSAPDQGSGPGQSSWLVAEYDSITKKAEDGWNSATAEAHAIKEGIEAGAEYYYKEADKWAKDLLGAKNWNQLHHIANALLGPESFNLGVACGVVANLGETAFGLVGLVKMLVLAGLYEELHGPTALSYSSPTAILLHAAGWVFDKVLGKQMKDADKQVKGIFTEVGKIIQDPLKFFGAAWRSTSGDYVKKWHEFERLAKTGRAVDQFKAGEIAGEVLTTVVLTVLAVISGVGAAIRTGEAVVTGVRALVATAEVSEAAATTLAKEAPELVKVAQGIEDPKALEGAASAAEGADATASSAAKSAPKPPPDVKMVRVFRGTSRVAENATHGETGHLLSDSAQGAFKETGSLDSAYQTSQATHEAWIDEWGSEDTYAQAHSAFGTEMPKAFGMDRTFVSVTTDPAVAASFAGPDGVVYEGLVPESSLVPQTLPGAGESEFLMRNGTDLLKPTGAPNP